MKFNFYDYNNWCLMLNKKPGRYESLKEFKRFIEMKH